MGEAWSAAGLGIFLFFVAIYIAAARTGHYSLTQAGRSAFVKYLDSLGKLVG